VGRESQLSDLARILSENRLVTLTGSGGAGKTRLAIEVAGRIGAEFPDGTKYVDLAPITEPELVSVTTARSLGLPDQPGRSATEAVLRFIADRHMLLILDNCEHLLDATAALVVEVLGSCPAVTVLATSREPIGMTGEAIWRVTSLSIADEAVELFTDRARLVSPDFAVTDDNAATLAEICHRLDGMPLAIELAAARVRALSLTDILTGLQDRFRILTGGVRTSVRRQQTLRASVDWSHALLTDIERVLFRRLAVFQGGFDLDAAQAVVTDEHLQRHQVFDEVALLVDKSLIVSESTSGPTRYRLLETVRQYALEKLGESGEADAIRARHRDHYTDLATLLDQPSSAGRRQHVEQAESDIDNLRAAFTWSRDNADNERALQLASAMQPFWLARSRVIEGLAWFGAVLADPRSCPADVTPTTYARAVADLALIAAVIGAPGGLEVPERALAIAREGDDPGLLLRALIACGYTAAFAAEVARPYLDEAAGLARESGDKWRLSQILWSLAYTAIHAGDPRAAIAAGEEGRDLADEIGDRLVSRLCRFWGLGTAHMIRGDLAEAAAHFRAIFAEAEADHDVLTQWASLCHLGHTLAWQGDTAGARAAATAAVDAAGEFGGVVEGLAYAPLAVASLAAGDVAAAAAATAVASDRLGVQRALNLVSIINPTAAVALAGGELTEARRMADEGVAVAVGGGLAMALTTRARVAVAQGESEQAERDARDALAAAAAADAHLATPDALECLAGVVSAAGSHREAARIYGAADSVRRETGIVRFKVYDDGYAALVESVRDALGHNDFDAARTEGAALSTLEAIAYARRGHSDRKRPTTGWDALTPTEHDVVRLVTDGLANKDIATRLFVSPRTVQSHLTHVYNKLGVSSRVQLVQEAARHS
jgi:predicted ATPase/DNA-binding CsgD family transcriptional regulator